MFPRRIAHYHNENSGGFTLVELAIVLIIIGVITGMGIMTGVSQIESARRKQTFDKVHAIKTAIDVFRRSYGRIPCPADLTLDTSNANYGVEAANAGSCVGGSPAATFNNTVTVSSLDTTTAVAGAVPTRTLGLPDEFQLDGWGNKFTLVMNPEFSRTDIFSTIPINKSCPGVVVQDATGATRASGAMAALISHGKNGHGAYSRSGTRIDTDSTNTSEQENCDCDADAADTGFDGVVVQRGFSQDSTDSTNSYDDLVYYISRWQLQNSDDVSAYGGPDAVVADDGSGISLYSLCGETLASEAALSPDPAGTDHHMSFSHDDKYLAISSSGAPQLRIYKYDNQKFIALSDPATQPTGNGYVAFSNDSSYMARGDSAAPRLLIYKRSVDTFTKLADPANLPSGSPGRMAFSHDNTYLAVPFAGGNRIIIYKRAGDVFTKLADPASLPSGTNGLTAQFSHDSIYLAVGSDSSPYITIYKRSGDTFTKLADPATIPTGNVNGIDFSSDSTYMAVAHDSSPYISIYKRAGDTFTKLANPAAIPAGSGSMAHFTSDDNHLVVSASGAPQLSVYSRSGDVFTRIQAANPGGNGGDMDVKN